MKVEVKPQNRPQYFEKNGVCVRIDNIVFIQKSDINAYGQCYNQECYIHIGMNQNQISIPCNSEEERAIVYSQLTTLLMLL